MPQASRFPIPNPLHQHGVQHQRISPDFANQRVDNYLLRELKNIPKTRVYRMIRTGEIRINGKRCQAHHRLAVGDILRIPPFRTAHLPKHNGINNHAIAWDILYEDDHIAVINKPSGVTVHGSKASPIGMIDYWRLREGCGRADLAHRLDRDTSGCLLIGKTPRIVRTLHKAFRAHRVKKQYYACVWGKWSASGKDTTRCTLPLLRTTAKSGEPRVRVDATGKPANTKFRLIAHHQTSDGAPISLVMATPTTGRTHQIRVHCQALGHPIVGDNKYARAYPAYPRLCLHAYRLRFPHPVHETMCDMTAPHAENWPVPFTTTPSHT